MEFKYPADCKLLASTPSPPEVATFDLEPPEQPPAKGAALPPYWRHYKVSFLKLDFPAAAQEAGFIQKNGEWTFREAENGTPVKANPLSGRGWKGLSGSYPTRLYLPEGAQVPPNFWHAGRYLGLSEGETIVVNGGGQVSMVLDFDPDLRTKPLREAILKSLRFFTPQPPLR